MRQREGAEDRAARGQRQDDTGRSSQLAQHLAVARVLGKALQRGGRDNRVEQRLAAAQHPRDRMGAGQVHPALVPEVQLGLFQLGVDVGCRDAAQAPALQQVHQAPVRETGDQQAGHALNGGRVVQRRDQCGAGPADERQALTRPLGLCPGRLLPLEKLRALLLRQPVPGDVPGNDGRADERPGRVADW